MDWPRKRVKGTQGKTRISLLLIAAAGFTLSFYVSYSKIYKPWQQKRRILEAEEYANFLIEKEDPKDTY